LTGTVSFLGVAFAALADFVPEEHRTVSYGLLMSGYYGAFVAGPAIPIVSHNNEATAVIAFTANIVALITASFLFPRSSDRVVETQPRGDSVLVDPHESLNSSTGRDSVPHTHPTSARNDALSCAGLCFFQISLEEATVLQTADLVWKAVMEPFREMSILFRSRSLCLVAAGAFFGAMVFASDATLVIYYIEDHLGVGNQDISQMFLVLGIFGIILQIGCLKPLIEGMGEKRVLVLSFLSGILHNFLYGAARSKATIYVAMMFSQVTKLNVPLLSSFASRGASASEQGQIQGALFAVNSIAYCVGPLIMEAVYQSTEHAPQYGPGFMFIFASGLYAVGTICVAFIPGVSSASHCPDVPVVESVPAATMDSLNDEPGDDHQRREFRTDHDEGDNASTGSGLEEPLLSPTLEHRR
jgi:MFS family permease